MSCQAKRSIRFFASAHEKTRKRLEKEKRPCRRRASDFHVGGVYLLHTHIHSIYISADGYICVGKNCITSRCFGDTSRDERNPWQHPEGQTNKKETHKKNKNKISNVFVLANEKNVGMYRPVVVLSTDAIITHPWRRIVDWTIDQSLLWHIQNKWSVSASWLNWNWTFERERERDWRRASFEWLRWVSARFDQLANIGRYISFRRGEWRAQIIMNFKTLTITMWLIKLQTLCPLEKSNNNTKKKIIK